MRLLLILLAVSSLATPLRAANEFKGDELVLDDFLVLPRVGQYGRVPIHVDPVAAQIAGGTWKPPMPGDKISATGNEMVTWSKVDLTSEGWLAHEALQGGYAYARVTSSQRQVVLLEAMGHAMVFVNGQPRVGDPYVTGQTVLPILLQKGTNEFLFHVAAGKLKARLLRPRTKVFLDNRDLTLPTLIRGKSEPVWVGLLLVNCQEQSLGESQVRTAIAGGGGLTSKTGSVPPLGVRKIAIPILPTWNEQANEADILAVSVAMEVSGEKIETEIELQIADVDQVQTRTFRSGIDDSVQSYQLLPARANSEDSKKGLLVTLHDANESSADHIAKFSAQEGAHVIAPEGRRAEGCDWEDWSATDVLEAIDDASSHVEFDPQRVWLRGTGTGGHGVLRLAGIAPDRWAALIPRSPWLEYPESQTSSDALPVIEMLERLEWSNRLTPLLRNVVDAGILLEGNGTKENPNDAGTRDVIEALKTFHPDFEFRAVKDDADLVDLTASLEFCKKHTSPKKANVHEVDLVTYNPGQVAQKHWLTIVSQDEQASLTRAAVKFVPQERLFIGLTANVAMLQIDVSHLEADTIVEVALDGQAVGEFVVDGKALPFLRNEEGWHPIPLLPGSFKQPSRYGGLRNAFENRAVLVYGTRGSDDENAWALAKARYDAETILVRLNGSAEVISDAEFDARAHRERNVVLYGNADTNSVWPGLLSDSPVQVRRTGVWIDARPAMGGDLACAFVQPRSQNPKALVGAISGTGIAGMRATDRLPLFVNGVVFPDLLLFSSQSLIQGYQDVRAAGFFGRAWTVQPGEIAWRDAAL